MYNALSGDASTSVPRIYIVPRQFYRDRARRGLPAAERHAGKSCAGCRLYYNDSVLEEV